MDLSSGDGWPLLVGRSTPGVPCDSVYLGLEGGYLGLEGGDLAGHSLDGLSQLLLVSIGAVCGWGFIS